MNVQSENISRQDSEFCDDKRHPEKSSITQKKQLKINLANEISLLANLTLYSCRPAGITTFRPKIPYIKFIIYGEQSTQSPYHSPSPTKKKLC